MITEIFVEGKKLDVSADISSLLTFAIDDVKDFSSRSTTFSKTVILPGTGNNNAIFGNIFELGSRNDYSSDIDNIGYNFNPAKSARCIIFQDNLQTFKGTLRMLEIDIDKGRIEYQVALNGELTSLSVALASGFLTDLDFSAYDMLYTADTIAATWDNPPGRGVYYPLIDYGTYSFGKHDWNIRTFRPALYVKEYIDKMFAATGGSYRVISFLVTGGPAIFIDVSHNGALDIVVDESVFTDKALTTAYPDGTYTVNGTDFEFTVAAGVVTVVSDPAKAGPGFPTVYGSENGNFRYQCDLFNTDRFKRLVVPHNQKALVKKGSTLVSASRNTDVSVALNANVRFATTSLTDFSYSTFTGIFTYTGVSSIYTTIGTVVSGSYTVTDDISGVKIALQKNGVDLKSETLGTTSDLPIPFYEGYSISNVLLNTGDTIRIHISPVGSHLPDEFFFTVSEASMTVTGNGVTRVNVNPGDIITINESIPQNIRQSDFLVSIVKLFNLYVVESQFDDRLIIIAPFIDFYSQGTDSIIDWTYKLNRDKVIAIKPLSELNSKIYNFNYKDDSDYWNDLYKKRYNQGYGSHIFDSEFEFASDSNALVLIFSPTPLVGYVGEDKIYSTIFKRTGTDAAPVEENVDSVIRILQTQKVTGAASWNMLNGSPPGSPVLKSLSTYGYAGHLDDPNNPGNDLNFGALNELFFILATGDLSNTQFNVYWSSYMAEITDKDSKLLTANFYLTPKDIFDLDFAKFIVVDGVLFRLNKITDYNASLPSDCQVELLKVINTAYSFPPGSEPSDDYAIFYTEGQPLIYQQTFGGGGFGARETNITYK